MKYWAKKPLRMIWTVVTAVTVALALVACSSGAPAGAQGPPGVGVTGATIDSSGHLMITLSNGRTIDAGSVAAPRTTTTTQPGPTTMSMADLFSLIQPVVVRIDVTGLGFQASGSGVIIRGDGYIMTNEHVIDSSTSITVTLSDDQQYPAAVTASDTNVDLAILKLTKVPANLPVATLGSASDISIGGVVVAAGYPLGSELPGPASFSQGIVSAVRTIDNQRFIQTDVAINPGNSGGALVNRSNAKIIGITNANVRNVFNPRQTVVGIGLAIPIDVVQTFIQSNLK